MLRQKPKPLGIFSAMAVPTKTGDPYYIASLGINTN